MIVVCCDVALVGKAGLSAMSWWSEVGVADW